MDNLKENTNNKLNKLDKLKHIKILKVSQVMYLLLKNILLTMVSYNMLFINHILLIMTQVNSEMKNL